VYHPGVRSLSTLAIVVLAAGVSAAELPPAIEDNSFLLEEAYNQGAGVVQHIGSFVHFRKPVTSSELGFAQEWPLGSQRHQLSYAVGHAWAEGAGGDFGDIALNYRLQVSDSSATVAIAPRLSLIIPTGDDHRGALQVNIPLSRRVSEHLAFHVNVGGTLTRDVASTDRDLKGYHAGASVIGIVSPTFNVMLEGLVSSDEEIGEDGGTARSTQTTLAPGLRFAVNRGDLQIVPGFGVPIVFGGGRTDAGVYLYLSFEHPFKKGH
jgi:hypothetical protein